jgi:hypothetical protein
MECGTRCRARTRMVAEGVRSGPPQWLPRRRLRPACTTDKEATRDDASCRCRTFRVDLLRIRAPMAGDRSHLHAPRK